MDRIYKLSQDAHERVYQRLESDLLAKSAPAAAPVAVVLGGQPGAGKSKLADIAMAKYFKNGSPSVINSEEYRYAHPYSPEILKKNDKKYAERTDPDVRVWTKRLFEAAVANKRDIIFEGTMRTGGPIMATIENLREAGYCIHIMIMAVRGEISRLGTLERYEDQKSAKGYGRWIDPVSHEEAYRGMMGTIRAIEKGSPVDSISIYNREGETLYHNGRGADGTLAKPPRFQDAASVIFNVQTQPMTKELEDTFSVRQKSLARRRREREAARDRF